MSTKQPKFKIRRYTLYTYDVWGNSKEGFDVNNVFQQGEISIRCRRKVYNEGTPHEFAAYDPTDLQLSRAVGIKGVEWDGETEYTLIATSKNGRPLCELRLEKEED